MARVSWTSGARVSNLFVGGRKLRSSKKFFHHEARNFQAILPLFHDNMLYFRSVDIEEYVVACGQSG